MNNIILNNGYELPLIGYGSAIVSDYKGGIKPFLRRCNDLIRNKRQYRLNMGTVSCLKEFSKLGYQMIDTSRAYNASEKVIGECLIKQSRENIKIVTKLCNTDQRTGDIERALKKSLTQLRTDYVDVYLMHWPVTDMYLDNWKKMEVVYKKGLCKAIGVCNCNQHHLEAIMEIAEIKPMVNQFECHPLFTQNELRKYCNEQDIQVMAYTPTARMDERLKKTVIVKLAQKYNKSMAQIMLRWHIQIGNIPIVNTINKRHLADNIDIFDFELLPEEVEAITTININSRLRYDPDNCDFNQL